MKTQKIQTCLQWQKAHQWFPGDGKGDGEDKGGEITKLLERDGFVHYLDCGHDFIGAYVKISNPER